MARKGLAHRAEDGKTVVCTDIGYEAKRFRGVHLLICRFGDVSVVSNPQYFIP